MRKPGVPTSALLAGLLLAIVLLPSLVALRPPAARRLVLAPSARAQDGVRALLECADGVGSPSCRADLARLVEALEERIALAAPVVAPVHRDREDGLIAADGRTLLAYAPLAADSDFAAFTALRLGFLPAPGNTLQLISDRSLRTERVATLAQELALAIALAALAVGLAVGRLQASARTGWAAAALTLAACASTVGAARFAALDSAGLLLAPPSLAALVAFGSTRRRARALGGESLSRALASAGPLAVVAFFAAGDARALASALAFGATVAAVVAPLLARLGPRVGVHGATPWAERFATRLELFARRRGSWVALCLCALVALCILGATAPRRSLTQCGALPRGSEAHAVCERLERGFGGSVLLHVSLDTGAAGGALDPSLLERVQSFQRHLEAEPGVAWTRSLAEASLRPATRRAHGGDSAFDSIPASRAEVSSALVRADARGWIDATARILRVDALVDPDSLALAPLSHAIAALAERRVGVRAQISHTTSGPDESVPVIVAVLGLIAGATLLAARTGRASVLVLALPGPALALAVVLGALGRELDPIAASASALALGASFAFALDYLERLRGLLRAGAELALAVPRALRDEANSLLAATAVQSVGLSLLFSSFEGLSIAVLVVWIAGTISVLVLALVTAPALRAAGRLENSTRW